VWLAPEQVRVLPITDDYREYAEQVTKRLHDAGVRVHLDARSETLKYRVAEGARMKVPYMVVLGRREAEQGTVAVNVRGAGKEQKPNSLPLDDFVARVVRENQSRALTLTAHGD
jgi:threonyl-tRNA synthetase